MVFVVCRDEGNLGMRLLVTRVGELVHLDLFSASPRLEVSRVGIILMIDGSTSQCLAKFLLFLFLRINVPLLQAFNSFNLRINSVG